MPARIVRDAVAPGETSACWRTPRRRRLTQSPDDREPLQRVGAVRSRSQGPGQIQPCVVESLVSSVLPEKTAGHVIHLAFKAHIRRFSTSPVIACKLLLREMPQPFIPLGFGHSTYPNAQSKIIITTNPAMRPKVASRSNPFRWLSGMISSLTTKIMAPPANASAHGKIG
jgi:hypothetical protein